MRIGATNADSGATVRSRAPSVNSQSAVAEQQSAKTPALRAIIDSVVGLCGSESRCDDVAFCGKVEACLLGLRDGLLGASLLQVQQFIDQMMRLTSGRDGSDADSDSDSDKSSGHSVATIPIPPPLPVSQVEAASLLGSAAGPDLSPPHSSPNRRGNAGSSTPPNFMVGAGPSKSENVVGRRQPVSAGLVAGATSSSRVRAGTSRYTVIKVAAPMSSGSADLPLLDRAAWVLMRLAVLDLMVGGGQLLGCISDAYGERGDRPPFQIDGLGWWLDIFLRQARSGRNFIQYTNSERATLASSCPFFEFDHSVESISDPSQSAQYVAYMIWVEQLWQPEPPFFVGVREMDFEPAYCFFARLQATPGDARRVRWAFTDEGWAQVKRSWLLSDEQCAAAEDLQRSFSSMRERMGWPC